MLWRIASLIFVLPLTSCGVGTNCAPPNRSCGSVEGRSTRYAGSPTIQRVSAECCDATTAPAGTCNFPGEWWGSVQLEGTATRVVLTVLVESADQWSEAHTLPLVDRDPYGHWEARYAEWTIANTTDCDTYEDCADRYQSTVSSLLSCTEPLSRTRFVLEIYDGSSTPEDCVTWGSVFPRPPEDCRDAEAEGLL